VALQVLRIDVTSGSLSKAIELADGSLRIPARVARTGVQVYQYADGSTVREYRSPAEVFSKDAVQSFDDVAVTIGHPLSPVSPVNWNSLAKGHIDDPQKSETFLTADVIVKDAATINAIKAGDLVELSAGYYVTVDPTPGVTPEGEPYDAVQTNIVGNHVALLPKGQGRAGPDVRLYADSKDGSAICYPKVEPDNAPSTEIAPMADKITTEARTDNAPVVPVAVYDKACAERDAALAKLATVESNVTKADSALADRVARRVLACRVDSSEATIKLATDSKVSDRDVMVAVIAAKRPSIKLDGKSDEYVAAMFDVCASEAQTDTAARNDAKRANTQAVSGLVNALTGADKPLEQRNDGVEDMAERAKQERDRKNRGIKA
jgi:hypothetical protein